MKCIDCPYYHEEGPRLCERDECPFVDEWEDDE